MLTLLAHFITTGYYQSNNDNRKSREKDKKKEKCHHARRLLILGALMFYKVVVVVASSIRFLQSLPRRETLTTLTASGGLLWQALASATTYHTHTHREGERERLGMPLTFWQFLIKQTTINAFKLSADF